MGGASRLPCALPTLAHSSQGMTKTPNPKTLATSHIDNLLRRHRRRCPGSPSPSLTLPLPCPLRSSLVVPQRFARAHGPHRGYALAAGARKALFCSAEDARRCGSDDYAEAEEGRKGGGSLVPSERRIRGGNAATAVGQHTIDLPSSLL
jgi:hypothetical protein